MEMQYKIAGVCITHPLVGKQDKISAGLVDPIPKCRIKCLSGRDIGSQTRLVLRYIGLDPLDVGLGVSYIST